MPIYEVSRVYTEVVHLEVGDRVRVQADSEEEARQLVRDNNHDEVVDGSVSTGHQKFTARLVDGPEIDSLEKIADSIEEIR